MCSEVDKLIEVRPRAFPHGLIIALFRDTSKAGGRGSPFGVREFKGVGFKKAVNILTSRIKYNPTVGAIAAESSHQFVEFVHRRRTNIIYLRILDGHGAATLPGFDGDEKRGLAHVLLREGVHGLPEGGFPTFRVSPKHHAEAGFGVDEVSGGANGKSCEGV